MKVKNFLMAGALTGLLLPSLALSASSDDTSAPPVNPACMVRFGNAFVNTAYIKQLFVSGDEPKIVITFASTYGSSSSASVTYKTYDEAFREVDKVADNINNCAATAQVKRAMKK